MDRPVGVGWSSPAEAAALGSVFPEAWAPLEDSLVRMCFWHGHGEGGGRCGPASGDTLYRRDALLSYFSTLALQPS